MNAIVICQAGPYTVTWDDGEVFCNGVRTAVTLLHRPLTNGAIATVDTLRLGANGKRDIVSLQPAQYAEVIKAGRIRADARDAEYRSTHAAELAALNARQRKADDYDINVNEGGEGYNPHRAAATGFRRNESQI